MLRRLTPHLAILALALTIFLGPATVGCGGGSGGSSNSTSSGTDGGDPPIVADGAGIVRDINSRAGRGAKVTFLDASGATLSTVTIGDTGNAGIPPAGAVRFKVDTSAIPTYYSTYLYKGLYYDANLANCNPALTSGAFATSIVLTPRASQAPPAPDGCSGG